MANIIINNTILQYTFLERVNPISNKYSFNCLIPTDHPQAQDLINACSVAWSAVSAGSPETAAQSMGYTILNAGDQATLTKKVHPTLLPMLDPSKSYLLFKGVQDANTNSPTIIYAQDAEGNVVVVPQRNIIGEGTIANVSLNTFGYATSGQKGVKLYGAWIQLIQLVVSPYAGVGAPPAPAENGYVASAEQLVAPVAPVAPVMQQPEVQQPAQQMQQPMQQMQQPVQQMQQPVQQQMPQQPLQQPVPQQPVQQQVPQMPAGVPPLPTGMQ